LTEGDSGITFIDGRHYRLSSGRIMTLGTGLLSFQVGDGVFITRYARPQNQESINCADLQTGQVLWTMNKTLGTKCSIDAGRHVLTLPSGTFETSLPIDAVIQSGNLFVVLARTRLGQRSHLQCVDSTGSLKWELPEHCVGLSPSSNPNEVFANMGIVTRVIDVRTGDVLAPELGQ
jgi:outer membrane protein assembly factor BamB